MPWKPLEYGRAILCICVGAFLCASSPNAVAEPPPETCKAFAPADHSDSWAQLGLLAHCTALSKPAAALEFAQIALSVAHDLDWYTIDTFEVDASLQNAWYLAWLQIAQAPQQTSEVRIIALDIAQQLATTPIPWKTYFTDSDEEFRAAALDLLPYEQVALTEAVLSVLRADMSERVALAAGQWLCETQNGRRAMDDVAAQMRILRLARTQTFAIVDRAQLAQCLVTKHPGAYTALLKESPPALRKQMQALDSNR